MTHSHKQDAHGRFLRVGPGHDYETVYTIRRQKARKRWSRYVDQANCRGTNPDLFFPERGASTVYPKAVCNLCAVKDECLRYALDSGEKHGIWGGTSERERRTIRKARNAAKRANGAA